MTENKNFERSIYSHNDPLEINELASLNDDFSPEFIEQLQNQITKDADKFTGKDNNTTASSDGALFEEVTKPDANPDNAEPNKPKSNIDSNIDDNFMKKYKAKLNKQLDSTETYVDESSTTQAEANVISSPTSSTVTNTKQIEELTNGSIIEKPIEKEQVSYNDSLDFLDENIKYSKYVIYIDPENTDFIESLTVKERKNLINKILREQDDIALTKKRYNSVNTFIKHTIIGVITTSLAIPLLYFVINSSLEASINNYRRSKTIFQTLYKEKGKIKTNSYKY